jgi:hypothetical protein
LSIKPSQLSEARKLSKALPALYTRSPNRYSFIHNGEFLTHIAVLHLRTTMENDDFYISDTAVAVSRIFPTQPIFGKEEPIPRGFLPVLVQPEPILICLALGSSEMRTH